MASHRRGGGGAGQAGEAPVSRASAKTLERAWYGTCTTCGWVLSTDAARHRCGGGIWPQAHDAVSERRGTRSPTEGAPSGRGGTADAGEACTIAPAGSPRSSRRSQLAHLVAICHERWNIQEWNWEQQVARQTGAAPIPPAATRATPGSLTSADLVLPPAGAEARAGASGRSRSRSGWRRRCGDNGRGGESLADSIAHSGWVTGLEPSEHASAQTAARRGLASTCRSVPRGSARSTLAVARRRVPARTPRFRRVVATAWQRPALPPGPNLTAALRPASPWRVPEAPHEGSSSSPPTASAGALACTP